MPIHSAHFRKIQLLTRNCSLSSPILGLCLFIGFFFVFVENHINLSPCLSYLSGALAGCAATLGSYPFDLLRTILASQGEPKV